MISDIKVFKRVTFTSTTVCFNISLLLLKLRLLCSFYNTVWLSRGSSLTGGAGYHLKMTSSTHTLKVIPIPRVLHLIPIMWLEAFSSVKHLNNSTTSQTVQVVAAAAVGQSHATFNRRMVPVIGWKKNLFLDLDTRTFESFDWSFDMTQFWLVSVGTLKVWSPALRSSLNITTGLFCHHWINTLQLNWWRWRSLPSGQAPPPMELL